MRRTRVSLLAPALLLAGACASSGTSHEPSPDRIVAVDDGGVVIRQSTDDQFTTAAFAAPRDKVWHALLAAYAEAGIAPSLTDPAAGKYGNTAFAVPRRVMNRPISQFFNCGDGTTGRLVDNGQVTALIVTTLTSLPDGTTSASTQVKASLRRTDSAMGRLLNCSSSGALEEFLGTSIRKQLGLFQ
ncbi:MAG: hypothetical protein ABI625_04720 [bacterium]